MSVFHAQFARSFLYHFFSIGVIKCADLQIGRVTKSGIASEQGHALQAHPEGQRASNRTSLACPTGTWTQTTWYVCLMCENTCLQLPAGDMGQVVTLVPLPSPGPSLGARAALAAATSCAETRGDACREEVTEVRGLGCESSKGFGRQANWVLADACLFPLVPIHESQ